MTYAPSALTVGLIADLVHQERPDWDRALIKVVLFDLASKRVAGNDLAIAALRAAGDRTATGPKVIGWRGAHWDGLRTTPPTAAARPRCGVCGHTEDKCWQMSRLTPDAGHAFEPVTHRVLTRL